MKVFIAVAICKFLYFIGSRIGRGSSLPGRVALSVCPGVLSRLRIPETVIAVTGSNGKTSTVDLLVQTLESEGKNVGWNHEGANQIEGAATMLLRIATFRGAVKRDALVLECDERYALKMFSAIPPSVIVVTNLCRDQLTRNGHTEFIQDCIRRAVEAAGEGVTLVLNADDPYTAALAGSAGTGVREPETRQNKIIWFGVGRGAISPESTGGITREVYDDGAFCPVCKGRMTYEYRIAGHFGGYNCDACGHSRRKPDYEVTGIDTDTGEITINGKITTRLAFAGLTGAYNLVAAIAAASVAGADINETARVPDSYELKGGRTLRFSSGGRDVILLVSKHENSLSYNQSMAWIIGRHKPCTVLIIVNSISRKYYTSETSWLWDVNFDLLADDSVRNIVLVGRYKNELMARFAMSAVGPGKYCCVDKLTMLREYVANCSTDDIFAITCFADKATLLKVI